MFENGEQVEIGLNDVRVIGKTNPSIVMLKHIRQYGKYYNTELDATRFVSNDSTLSELGLRGQKGTQAAFQMAFGHETEKSLLDQQKSAEHPPEKETQDKLNRAISQPKRVHKTLPLTQSKTETAELPDELFMDIR